MNFSSSVPRVLGWKVLILLLLMSSRADAFDEFDPRHSPSNFVIKGKDGLKLSIMGEIQIELHDIEGAGGPGNDSPTDTRTLGTRSPFVEIDSFWLALRLDFAPGVGFYSILDFWHDGADIGAAWLDLKFSGPSWWLHHLELGYHTPFVKVDRRSERYPLIASVWWREPELHLIYESSFLFSPRQWLEVGMSMAMMRPLEPRGIQESNSMKGTINVLGLGPARSFSGNKPVIGARALYHIHGAFLEAFAFLGKLAAEGGTDVLRSAYPFYRFLDGHNEAGTWGDFHWWGGRLGYTGNSLRIMLEAIGGREDLIERWGAYGQLSWHFALRPAKDWFRGIEPLVRLETLRIKDSTKVHGSGKALRSPAFINAVSWDYNILTTALICNLYRDLLKMRLEYYFIQEKNGVPALGIKDQAFRNNELLLQLELRF